MRTIAVFGASGRTGRHLVRLALSRGYSARAFLRVGTSAMDARPVLSVIRGALEDKGAVKNAVAGAECVMVAFGPRAESRSPFCARATENIVEAMEGSGVRRLICVTGAMIRSFVQEKEHGHAMGVGMRPEENARSHAGQG